MENAIYMFEGEQDTLVEEKFENPISKRVQIFVWKSADGRLGFEQKGIARLFINELLIDKITVLMPKLTLVNDKDLLDKHIYSLRGITFLNKPNRIISEFKELELYEQLMKKNGLLEKYGKSTTYTPPPKIMNWYNSENRKYSNDFTEFVVTNSFDFIVWVFSDFGTYFFSFDNRKQEIKAIAEKLDIEYVEVDNIKKMPYD